MPMRQQEWSRQALDRVRKAKDGGSDYARKYRTLCMKGAGLIRQSGLIQALVFLEARSGEEGKAFARDLAAVRGGNIDHLKKEAQDADLRRYMVLTNDVVNIAIWFRRFAQSELAEEA